METDGRRKELESGRPRESATTKTQMSTQQVGVERKGRRNAASAVVMSRVSKGSKHRHPALSPPDWVGAGAGSKFYQRPSMQRIRLSALAAFLKLGSASHQSGDCETAIVHLCIALCREK